MAWSPYDDLDGSELLTVGDQVSPERPGPRVLLVEDNAIIGLGLETTLLDAGFEVLGPVQDLEQAVDQASKDGFDVALLDVGLGDGHAFPVADILAERGIPFVFLSGYDQDIVPDEHAGRPFLQKPYSTRTMTTVLRLTAGV